MAAPLPLDIQLEITIDRNSSIYSPGNWGKQETVSGIVKILKLKKPIENISDFYVQGDGCALIPSQKVNPSTLETLNKEFKPHIIFHKSTKLTEKSEIKPGENEFPYKIKLEPASGYEFLESYLGHYIAITYQVKAYLKIANGGGVAKIATNFFMSVKEKEGVPLNPNPFKFTVTDEKLENKNAQIKPFKITGELTNLNLDLNKELEGYITVEVVPLL